MLQDVQSIEITRHIEALRLRLEALDAAATGIAEGIRQNTLGADAAYQLLDLIGADLKARTEALMTMVS
jgi:hypothetical protein